MGVERHLHRVLAEGLRVLVDALPVLKIDLSLSVIDAYPSARQASLDTNISRSSILLYCNRETKRSVIAPDGYIYAWDDTRRLWATLRRAMKELDEMGLRYNNPFTGRYFDLEPEPDFDIDPALWWSDVSPALAAGGGYPFQIPAIFDRSMNA